MLISSINSDSINKSAKSSTFCTSLENTLVNQNLITLYRYLHPILLCHLVTHFMVRSRISSGFGAMKMFWLCSLSEYVSQNLIGTSDKLLSSLLLRLPLSESRNSCFIKKLETRKCVNMIVLQPVINCCLV
ncbi:hypothetical protein V1477_006175 [Vespula maculifrons]|uniref:Uncharacterized protein n=1 Tax=Vespula maculifrons TaxID=7453 RepID=A0ABD2CKN6_VESMC